MAIKGDLKDMSLPGLIQMVCMEQRKAALVVRRNRVDEGVLFFDEGEIVHARMGKLVGEDAVYQLLQWTEGAFEMGDLSRVPRRTIHTSWRYLMLEGMRKMDEQAANNGNGAATASLTAADEAADEVLETAVIYLLSKLEHGRADISSRRNRRRPPVVLQIMSKMINETAVFAKENLYSRSINLQNSITTASNTFPAMRLIQTTNNHIEERILLNLYSNWSAGKNERRRMFDELVMGLVDVLHTYFSHTIATFHTTTLADEWRETSELFLEELKNELKKVKF